MRIFLKISRKGLIFNLIIINFAIALKFAIIGVGVNLLLVSILSLIIIYKFKSSLFLDKKQIMFYLLPLCLLLPFLTHPSNYRFVSFFYSLMFLAIFQVILSYIHKNNISISFYKKTLQTILSLYFFVSLLQIILFPFGIFFNQIWISNNETRINSLATEPSYTGIIVAITLYSYLQLRKNENAGVYLISNFIKDIKYWVYAVLTIYATQSGYSFVFFVILLFTLIPKKHLIKSGMFSILISCLIIVLGIHFEIKPILRVTNLFVSLFSLNVNEMALADHSGSIRVAPIIIFISQFNLHELNSWIGNGIGFNNQLMASIIPGIDINSWSGGGFLPMFIYDYGLIAFIIFFLFIKENAIIKVFSFESLFLFLIFLNASFNTQLFWYSIIIFTINKYFIINKFNLTSEVYAIE